MLVLIRICFRAGDHFYPRSFIRGDIKWNWREKKKKLDAGLFDFLIRNVLLIVSCILDNFYARGGYYWTMLGFHMEIFVRDEG